MTWAPSKCSFVYLGGDVGFCFLDMEGFSVFDHPDRIWFYVLLYWQGNVIPTHSLERCRGSIYLLQTEFGRTGRQNIWLEVDIRISLSSFRMLWPWAKYSPVQPDQTQSLSTLSYGTSISVENLSNLFQPNRRTQDNPKKRFYDTLGHTGLMKFLNWVSFVMVFFQVIKVVISCVIMQFFLHPCWIAFFFSVWEMKLMEEKIIMIKINFIDP